VLVLPGGQPLPWSDLTLDIAALALILPAIALAWFRNAAVRA
jgi:hypothetical protein